MTLELKDFPEFVHILQEFSLSLDFQAQMQLVFGKGLDFLLLESLREEWRTAQILLPEIQIINTSTISNALGAYGKETRTIYLSQDLFSNSNNKLIIKVLLEEYAHYLDSLFESFKRVMLNANCAVAQYFHSL